MTNNMKYSGGNPENKYPLSAEKKGTCVWLTGIERDCKRFLTFALLLPEKEFLGWQFSAEAFRQIDGYAGFAFSGSAAGVSAEDFSWIFKSYGRADGDAASEMEDLYAEGRKIYRFSPVKDGKKGISPVDDRMGFFEDPFANPLDDSESSIRDMFDQIVEADAVIRIAAGPVSESAPGHGVILISVPGEMSLRMRAAITRVFPHLEVKEMDASVDTQTEEMLLPDKDFLEAMTDFLALVSYTTNEGCFKKQDGPGENAEEQDTENSMNDLYKELEEDLDSFSQDVIDALSGAGNDCEDGSGQNDSTSAESSDGFAQDGGASSESANGSGKDDSNRGDDASFTPIEELNLSVRSINCLKRADMFSVEKLLTLTDDDFMQIRNLGRKCMDEIKRKLAEYCRTHAVQPAQEEAPLNVAESMEKLDQLIGLEEVKTQVRKIAAFARMKQEMQRNGGQNLSMSLNMEFVGNPGTAKTTTARIVSEILHGIGILPGSGIVEVGRADLVGQYVGHTAPRVKEIFKKARGKVLFIDEAYSLVEDSRGSYGDEAINTIVQEMENNRDHTVVIFAGYPEEMKKFFSRNPGLRSRVPFSVTFKDYSAEELLQIAELEADSRGFSIDPQAKEKVLSICESAAGNPERGNGRFCRNLIESAILEYASRVYGSDLFGRGDCNCDESSCAESDGADAGCADCSRKESGSDVSDGADAGRTFTLTESDFAVGNLSVEASGRKKTKNPIGFRAA